MVIELICVADIVSGVNQETGEPIILKKNVEFKKTFCIDKLTHEHYIDQKGRILKSFCNVYSENQSYKVKHSYEYISNLIKPVKVGGYITHARKTKYKV